MTEEQLKETKEEKRSCYKELLELRHTEAKVLQELYMVQEKIHKMKCAYESLDRKIAMEEKLTICPAAGSEKLKTRRIGISGLTKEEALKIIQSLPD